MQKKATWEAELINFDTMPWECRRPGGFWAHQTTAGAFHHGSALQEVGLNLSAGIVSFTSLTTFVASPGGKRVRRPCNYMTCIHHLLLFFDSLLFLKVPRDRSAACKIICLFVWVSGKLDGFIGIFFKGLSHPHLVNISMFRVFEVLSVNW